MMTTEIKRRAFLRSSLLVGAAAIAAPAVPAALRKSTPASAAPAVAGSVPSSTSFNLQQGSKALFTAVDPKGNTTPQSFAFDARTGNMYVAACTGTRSNSAKTYQQHLHDGDITISEFNTAGQFTGRFMDLAGCGHGYSIAAVSTTGEPDMWFEFGSQPDGSEGYGTLISHYPFTSAPDPNSWNPISISTLQSHQHNPFPGTRHNSPAWDPVNKRMAVRSIDASTGVTTIGVFSYAEITGSTPYTSLAKVSFRNSSPKFDGQGFTLLGNYLYFITGPNSGQCAPKSSTTTVAKMEVNSGKLYGPFGTAAFNQFGYTEPEGMAIQIVNGAPRLCFGISAHNSGGNNCSDTVTLNVAYKDSLS